MPEPIHPTAVIHPDARVGDGIRVGPFAVVDAGVTLGDGCTLGPHVYLTGRTAIGRKNSFGPGCVIGEAPQDLKYGGEDTELVIGDGNDFREHVTVHRSNTPDEATRIGDECFLMAHSHVGHNSVLGSRVVLANGALLGGHVTVDDQAFISGNCVVHQFVRIGRLAMMQGISGLSKDLPPFTMARQVNGICGLNVVGMRRAGMGAEERTELKRLYRVLFRSGLNTSRALERARDEFGGEAAREMIEFVASSKRGIPPDVGYRKDD